VKLWNLNQGNPSENALTFRGAQVPISSAMLTGDGQWLILAQQKPNASCTSGLRLWPLVFDEAFECAAEFAEARFPTLYQRRKNSMMPSLESPEERIAAIGRFMQTGMQFPMMPDVPPIETPQGIPSAFDPPFGTPQANEIPVAQGDSTTDTTAPPAGIAPPLSDGQIHLTQPGISISWTPSER